MSTLDERPKDVSGDVVEDSFCGSDGSNNNRGFVILLFIVGFSISMILGWIIFPKLLYTKKSQPFNFNHALHVNEVSEGCDSCHYFYDDGNFSGVPKIDRCVDCHEDVIGESEDEAIFVEQYIDKGKEVPWFIYSKQPNCVFFSHAAHLKGSTKLDCVVCHGHIGESEKSKPYEYNRITGYSRDIWGKNIAGFKKNSWDRMKMDDCAECHKDLAEDVHSSSVQTRRDACFVCHK